MRCASSGRRLCLVGAALGALGLAGWLTDTPWLTSIVPGHPRMTPNTGLALLLIGIAGALRFRQAAGKLRRALALAMTLVVLAIGVATLAEYLLGIDLGIDRLLMRGEIGRYAARPLPPTALALTLLGAAVLGFDHRLTARARPAEWLVLAAAIIALTTLIGHVFGTGPFYRLPVIGVALPTSISLLVTSVGLLLERPDSGLMGIVTSRGPGGTLIRKLILPVILIPPVLGLVVIRGLASVSLDDPSLVVATLVAAVTVMGLVQIIVTAVPLDRAHAALESSLVRTRDLVEQASDGIFMADATEHYVDVNAAGCRLLGLPRDEIVGKQVGDFVSPDEVERLRATRAELREGGSHVGEWRVRHRDGDCVPVEVSAKVLPDGRWQFLVRDITLRKAKEEVARRSRARIEGIIEIASDAIISIDEEQRITIFNRGAEQIFGWSHDEMLGQQLGILIPERLREIHNSHVTRFAAEPIRARRMGERDRPILGLRKDGTEFPAEAAISKLRIEGELAFTVVLRDMTERVRLEHELRDAHDFLENVLESSTEYSIIALDLDRRIALWNEGARRNYGYSATEIVGMPADTLHVPEDIAAGVTSSLYARALEEGSAEVVLRRRRKSGSEFVASIVVSRRTARGAPIGYLVISRDVTREHRRSEQEHLLASIGPLLTASIDRMQLLASAVEYLVTEFADACVVDLSDRPETDYPVRWKVTHRDPRKKSLALALEKIPLDARRPHLSRAALETKRANLITHVAAEYLDSIAQSAEHRELLSELAPVSLISVPLHQRGLLLGALTFVSSDPHRRYDEVDVMFAEELGRRLAWALDNAHLFDLAGKAVAVRDEVLGIVAHDLRNPLNAILMQSELLSRQGQEPERRSQKPVQLIRRSAMRMNRLIADLLDVTRMEGGRLSVEQARVPAGQIILESVEAQASLAAAAAIELRLAVPRDLPEVWADRDRLFQIFENLIGNAVRFTRPGGHITVGAASQDRDVLFWVEDSGIGISEADLPHLFDRFWQARKTQGGGAGLGLPIVKGIVEAHGGHVWVETMLGRGSTFFFTIPLAPRAEKPRGQPAAHA